MPRKFVDLSIYLENDVLSRPAGVRAEDPVLHAREHLRADRALLPGLQEGRPARRRRLGGGVRAAVDPQRHAPRRALPLPLDDGRRSASRKPAIAIDDVPLGVVLPARREAGLPPLRRRLRGDRGRRRGGAATHRPRAQAAGDRGGQHPRRLALRPARLRRRPAAAWATRRRCTCWSAACASLAPTPGAGTRRSCTPRRSTARRHDASLIWEGHKAGRDIGYCHLEKLHNLEALPAARLLHQLLPAQDPRRVGRLDARGGDLR